MSDRSHIDVNEPHNLMLASKDGTLDGAYFYVRYSPNWYFIARDGEKIALGQYGWRYDLEDDFKTIKTFAEQEHTEWFFKHRLEALVVQKGDSE